MTTMRRTVLHVVTCRGAQLAATWAALAAANARPN